MSRLPIAIPLLAAFSFACGDTAHRPIPSGAPGPLAEAPASPAAGSTLAPTPALTARDASPRPPLELSATSVEGFPPLPSYRAKVRNVSGRPVRSVVATVVYFDGKGLAMPGENQDVQFGSPLKAIEPGVTLETTFLSRVDRAPSVRLVVHSVTFLEKGRGDAMVPREWKNPRYDAELADLGAKP